MPAGKRKPKQSLDDAAKQEMLDALEELLAQQDFELSIPYNRLNQAVADVVNRQGKVISSLQSKIAKGLHRDLVTQDNSLEQLRTTILNGLNAHQADIEFLLTQLAAKSGVIGVGDTLEKALLSEAAQGPELGALGTLVLQVGAAEKWLERICCALERIADCLCAYNPSADVTMSNPPSDTSADLSTPWTDEVFSERVLDPTWGAE